MKNCLKVFQQLSTAVVDNLSRYKTASAPRLNIRSSTDIPAMNHVGLPVAPRDGAHEVRAVARYVTRADGGYGVARELLEEILRVRGAWLDSAVAFGW